jgi:hypothetical protein
MLNPIQTIQISPAFIKAVQSPTQPVIVTNPMKFIRLQKWRNKCHTINVSHTHTHAHTHTHIQEMRHVSNEMTDDNKFCWACYHLNGSCNQLYTSYEQQLEHVHVHCNMLKVNYT